MEQRILLGFITISLNLSTLIGLKANKSGQIHANTQELSTKCTNKFELSRRAYLTDTYSILLYGNALLFAATIHVCRSGLFVL